jgi:hypothetical protein
VSDNSLEQLQLPELPTLIYRTNSGLARIEAIVHTAAQLSANGSLAKQAYANPKQDLEPG